MPASTRPRSCIRRPPPGGSDFPNSVGTLPDIPSAASETFSFARPSDQDWIFGKTALVLYSSLEDRRRRMPAANQDNRPPLEPTVESVYQQVPHRLTIGDIFEGILDPVPDRARPRNAAAALPRQVS